MAKMHTIVLLAKTGAKSTFRLKERQSVGHLEKVDSDPCLAQPAFPSPLEGEGARRAGEGYSRIGSRFRNRPIPIGSRHREHRPMPRTLLMYAKRMRRTSTEAEARMWWLLRAARFRGFKFRRQQPIGDYIVDFVCFERKLIVEVDGSQHLDAVAQDDARTAWLESVGFTVLRFWNDEVLRDAECVMRDIARAIDGG